MNYEPERLSEYMESMLVASACPRCLDMPEVWMSNEMFISGLSFREKI